MAARSPPLIVRHARRSDAPVLSHLWYDLRAEESGTPHPERSPGDLAPFRELAARRCREETSLLLVAHRGDRPVGFYFGRIRGAVAEGIDLYVVPEARRQAVGRALVESALEWYASRGAAHIKGALRGGEGCRAFWATVWEKQPSRLREAREAAGVEWRVRSIGAEEAGSGGGSRDHPRLQGHPTSQPKS